MTAPPSLRILMTADAVGGVWVYATMLARRLCERGCEITLLTLGPPPRREQQCGWFNVPRLDLTVTDLALEWMDPEGRDFNRAQKQLAEVERRVKPDVIHLNGYREALGEWQAPVLVAAHSCVGSWWRACRGHEPREPRWQPYLANVRRGLAAATTWVAPTAAFRDVIRELYDPPTAGHMIWNGLDRPGRVTTKEPFILAAGRLWDEAKNINSLAQAAPHLSWPIRVAGPASSSASHATPGVATGLQALGELSRLDLMAQMRRASVFVAPALYEPFGLTVLEAAAAGCALVLSDIKSFRELWSDAALFVDVHEPGELTSALALVIRDAGLRRDLQQRAAHRARGYSLTGMVDSYLDLYHLMARPSHATPQPQADEVRP